jgi:thiol peroxidase
MAKRFYWCLFSLFLAGCATGAPTIPVDHESVLPGGTVMMRGMPQKLTGTPIEVGKPVPATELISNNTMAKVNLAALKGKVLLISVVPSIDTKVCEAQTHYLGEKGQRLPAGIVRITVSRDTPFAQKRFADEAKLHDITFLSDYRDGAFGRATGLLQEESMLLGRAVFAVDKAGIVR